MTAPSICASTTPSRGPKCSAVAGCSPRCPQPVPGIPIVWAVGCPDRRRRRGPAVRRWRAVLRTRAGFPQRWWWAEAHDDFDQGDAWRSPGTLELGPIHREVTGVIVRPGRGCCGSRRPPWCHLILTGTTGTGRSVRTAIRRRNWTEAEPAGHHTSSRCRYRPSAATSTPTTSSWRERCAAQVRRMGRVIFDGTSHLAALEVGDRRRIVFPNERAARGRSWSRERWTVIRAVPAISRLPGPGNWPYPVCGP